MPCRWEGRKKDHMQWQMSVDITHLTGRMRCRGIARLQLIPKKESKGSANDLLQGADKRV